jgi:hypothetical protein
MRMRRAKSLAPMRERVFRTTSQLHQLVNYGSELGGTCPFCRSKRKQFRSDFAKEVYTCAKFAGISNTRVSI